MKAKFPMLRLTLLGTLLSAAGPSFAAADLVGTYRLVRSIRTVVATGKVEDSFGRNPQGYIMYGSDGRMLVLMVRSDRPKPSFSSITDADRTRLFDTMAAYGGTYTFDGTTVTHKIDISWNEILTGTTVIRSVRKKGRTLIYTTGQGPAPTDGKIVTSELVWEKVAEPNSRASTTIDKEGGGPK